MAGAVLSSRKVLHEDQALTKSPLGAQPRGKYLDEDPKNIAHFIMLEDWGKVEHLCNKEIALQADSPMSSFFYDYLAFALQRQNKLKEAEDAANRANAIRAQAMGISASNALASGISSAPVISPAQLSSK